MSIESEPDYYGRTPEQVAEDEAVNLDDDAKEDGRLEL